MAGDAPLTIWAVSDGRAGIAAQVEGLAAAVARMRPAHVLSKTIGWRFGAGRLPTALNPGWPGVLTEQSGLAPPWPNIWIAAGRATLPLSMRMRRRTGGRTFVVQTQDPRHDLSPFDMVIPPAHDGLSGEKVFPIAGAPNRLTAERLRDAAADAHHLAALPSPRVAVIIGGTSKAFDLPPARAEALGREMAEAVQASGGSVMVSFTRRTPAAAQQILRRALEGLPGEIWDGRGDNPYFAYLGWADAVLVTEDSTNLATDAASTGKPVHVLAMHGGADKFRRFHADLAARGATRPFAGRIETWSYPPLAETDRAAAELLRRYDLWRTSH